MPPKPTAADAGPCRLDWDDLRHFLAIARHGTLSGAARALGVRQSTMSRRLAALEARAGAQLLQKTPDGYRPTAAGEAILGPVERIEAEADTVARTITGTDLRLAGSVRITSVETLATLVLMPVLAGHEVSLDASVADSPRISDRIPSLTPSPEAVVLGSIQPVGDEDWFAFTVTGLSAVQIARAANLRYDIAVTLHNLGEAARRIAEMDARAIELAEASEALGRARARLRCELFPGRAHQACAMEVAALDAMLQDLVEGGRPFRRVAA